MSRRERAEESVFLLIVAKRPDTFLRVGADGIYATRFLPPIFCSKTTSRCFDMAPSYPVLLEAAHCVEALLEAVLVGCSRCNILANAMCSHTH